MAEWVDLLDPDEAELRKHAADVDRGTFELLLARADPEGRVRPTLRGQGDYVFGLLLSAVLEPAEDRLYYQEIDLVIRRDRVLTVRKTPPDGKPFDPARVREVCSVHQHVPPGKVVYHLVDEVAERYLDLLDGIDGEIDELEENVDVWESERLQKRLTEIRHDLLHLRRTLSPTRDAVRGIVDGRTDIEPGMLRRQVFSDELERAFGPVLDKFLRATESLEFSRDLLAAVRDYHSTQIAYEQNETIRRLTVIASLVLLPTFIVGVYGQNFSDIPERSWHFGYAFSWGVIVLVTIAQLIFFRRKRWI
jgi:magnesium transporter